MEPIKNIYTTVVRAVDKGVIVFLLGTGVNIFPIFSFNITSPYLRRIEMAREEADLQDQQVPAKSAATESRRGAEQSVQGLVGVHRSRLHSEEIRTGE